MVLHCEIGSDRGQKHIQVYTRHFLSSLHHCCSCGKVGSLPPAHGQSDYPCGCGRVDRSSCLDACFLKSSQPSAVSAIVLPTMRQQRFTQRSIFPHVSTRRIACRQGHPIEPERERLSVSPQSPKVSEGSSRNGSGREASHWISRPVRYLSESRSTWDGIRVATIDRSRGEHRAFANSA